VVGASPDGKPGPATFAATVGWLRAKGFIAPAPTPIPAESIRARVVLRAMGEVGIQNPQKYIRDAAPIYIGLPPNAKAWCGIFALWCLRQEGLTDRLWRDGIGFVEGYLPRISLPEPGDIAYFTAGQHYAIVQDYTGGIVYTIDGNSMRAPAEGVTAKHYDYRDVAALYSIRNLVAAKSAAG